MISVAVVRIRQMMCNPDDVPSKRRELSVV